MDDQLLIMGLDPGTTVGYALLCIDGRLVALKSSRQLSLSLLISRIIKHGIIIVTATDKSPAPKYVESFSAKVGAKLIKPKESLSIKKKKNLIKKFKIRNRHERDALASAIFALKKLKPMFRKVDNCLIKNKKLYLANDLKRVLLKNRLSIADNIKILEKNSPMHYSPS